MWVLDGRRFDMTSSIELAGEVEAVVEEVGEGEVGGLVLLIVSKVESNVAQSSFRT